MAFKLPTLRPQRAQQLAEKYGFELRIIEGGIDTNYQLWDRRSDGEPHMVAGFVKDDHGMAELEGIEHFLRGYALALQK